MAVIPDLFLVIKPGCPFSPAGLTQEGGEREKANTPEMSEGWQIG